MECVSIEKGLFFLFISFVKGDVKVYALATESG